MKPEVSVITLTCNKLTVTRRCLESWLQTTGIEWELIAVDNGSSDGTFEWLQEFAGISHEGMRMKVIRNERNAGCSTARNQGAAAASTKNLVFVDNDVALRSRRWLKNLLDTMGDNASAGLVGPKLVYPFPPHLIQSAGAAVSKDGRVQFRGRGSDRNEPAWNRKQEVQCLLSACLLCRRTLFEEAGGFDEAFNPVQFEDFDLCYKIRSRGHAAIYDPSIEMYHFESTTTGGTPGLNNTAVVVRHGLLFKEKWRHMFSREEGPETDQMHWRKIAMPPFASIGVLATI